MRDAADTGRYSKRQNKKERESVWSVKLGKQISVIVKGAIVQIR